MQILIMNSRRDKNLHFEISIGVISVDDDVLTRGIIRKRVATHSVIGFRFGKLGILNGVCGIVCAAPSRSTWNALIIRCAVSVAMIQRDLRRTSSIECQARC